jgi:VWFA-related protein
VALLAAVLLTTVCVFAQEVQVTIREARFTVTDHEGRFVTDLGRDDLIIYDNDVRQQIDTFDKKLQSPVSLAVLIDRSASVADHFPFVLDAASAFVKSMIHEKDDRGLVVGFDSKVYLLQDWTDDSNALVDSIRKLTSAGGTSVFDAIYKTCRDKFDVADTREKSVVLVTDGEDTTSRASFEQALQMAKSAGATIYVVGIRAEGSLNTREFQGNRVLTNLTDLTGGRVLYPDAGKESQLSAVFQTLQGEMRNEYRAAYYLSAPLDNSFHRIRIETKDKSLTVHAPKGYYARKLGAGQ